MGRKNIPFSPPDIGQMEIDAVTDVLSSGWITTGPKTKEFEQRLAERFSVDSAICLNSATAGMELVLRLFDIGPGDEVITTPYTYAATINVILHCGALPILVDINQDDWSINPQAIATAITRRTKAVIPVDIGGWPCDYDAISEVLQQKKSLYSPKKGTLQEQLKCPLLLADAAHSIGAYYKERPVGSLADFTVFSFHAVKNVTTAEGGAILFNRLEHISADILYSRLSHLCLHGQSKDAHAKQKSGAWQYEIVSVGFKYNMTDIAAAMGLVQLQRYDDELYDRRRHIFSMYDTLLSVNPRILRPHWFVAGTSSSCHIYMVRLADYNESKRNSMIKMLSEQGIATNVHFIPIPMHPVYRSLGYKMDDYPNAFNRYANEITLPVYPALSDDQVAAVSQQLLKNIGQT